MSDASSGFEFTVEWPDLTGDLSIISSLRRRLWPLMFLRRSIGSFLYQVRKEKE